MKRTKATRRLVANCIVIGGRASTAIVQKIADAATLVANKMLRSKTAKDRVIAPNFNCDITTNFTEVNDGEVTGYLFEIVVHYKQEHFTMMLTLKPFRNPCTTVHLGWHSKKSQHIDLKNWWQYEGVLV